jgi:NAD(P)-dependent dehydrogenase (short-subunit alcohol dehydrogenase family)
MEDAIYVTIMEMSEEEMTDSTVLVTGASGGIGRLLTERLRERGFTVIGWDMNPDPDCDPLPVDVADWESVRRAADGLPDGLDAVVNCAGAALRGALLDTSMADFDWLMRVNVTGTAHVSAATHSRLAGGGVFVAVGSVAAQVPMAERAAYCASKAAVAMLSRCLASEWADDGIQVVCVNPGFMDVGMAASSSSSGATSLVDVLARTPTGRLVPADRLLDVFELLVSGRMRGVAGSEITVDEGFTAGWRTARSVR